MLELAQIAVRSSAGHEPPLVQRELSQAEILRYQSATPMLITMLVAPQAPGAIEAVVDQLSGYAKANVQGTGPMYQEALNMVREAQILGKAAAEANRQFGI